MKHFWPARRAERRVRNTAHGRDRERLFYGQLFGKYVTKAHLSRVQQCVPTVKDATVKRYHYDSHDQLRSHLAEFITAYNNYVRRLKTLKGLTPYEYICKIWTKEPERFKLDPIHKMPGLNT